MSDQHHPFALPIGTQISGYEIVRVLGVGGFGITYEGFNPVTRRRAAIKEFFPRGIASRENATQVVFSRQDTDVVAWALERFRRSTTELCDFKHPNIVDVLNYVPANETGYMFMEQVEGETLEQWLRRKDVSLRFEEMLAVLNPICDALEYVHAKKFIHRDIAPDNIMIRKDGRPMLIDFGAIKIIAQTAQTRAASGRSYGVAKQHYSPPEQMDEDAELDPRADVYALAAVLYRAVSGHPPIDSDKRKNDLILKGADSYASVAQTARIPLPQPVIDTIDRSLSLKPALRPSSIAEFRAGLRGDGGQTALVTPADPVKVKPMPTPGFSGPGAKAPTPAEGVAASMGSAASAQMPMSAKTPKSWIGIAAIASVVLIIAGVFIGSANFSTTSNNTNTQDRPKDGPKQSTSSARGALDRANRLSSEGKHQDAIAAYSEALKLAGTDDALRVQAYKGRAARYGALRQHIEQIADLADAIRLAPSDIDTYRDRADAFISRAAAASATRIDDLNRAKADLDRVINRAGVALDYEKRGLIFENLGNRTDALADFREALRRDSNRSVSRQAIQRLGG